MPLHPYLIFNGNAREATMFYANAFGLEEPQFLTYGSVHSDEIPPEAADLIMHTNLDIDGGKLMISDEYPGNPYKQGNNFTVAYITNDEEAIKNAYEKLKEGGTVELELQETPWSKLYGSLEDKYGVKWQFSHQA